MLSEFTSACALKIFLLVIKNLLQKSVYIIRIYVYMSNYLECYIKSNKNIRLIYDQINSNPNDITSKNSNPNDITSKKNHNSLE